MQKYKKPAQENHDFCFLPRGFELYSRYPVYVIVALWCLSEKKWINRNDIAKAFKMNERKASYFLSYILKKKTMIKSKVRKVRYEGSPVYCYEVKVDDIMLQNKSHVNTTSFPRVSNGRKKLIGNANEKERQLLRNLWASKGKKSIK